MEDTKNDNYKIFKKQYYEDINPLNMTYIINLYNNVLYIL